MVNKTSAYVEIDDNNNGISYDVKSDKRLLSKHPLSHKIFCEEMTILFCCD